MIDRNFEPDDEPLWSASVQLHSRMLEVPVLDHQRSFLLSLIYSSVNVFLLILFGIYATNAGEPALAKMLLSIAGLIVTGKAVIWVLDLRALAPHFTTATMALMCLCLFYTGGLQNTGPLYYFAFPTIALSLHDRLRGVMWVLGLLILTLFLWNGGFGFDSGKYNSMFVNRLVGICLLISLFACIPEYYRSLAERKLLLAWADFQQLRLSDPSSGLASRNLLGKILHMEYQRNFRYGSACCLLFLQFDTPRNLLHGNKVMIDDAQLHGWFGGLLRDSLRTTDIGGRWDNNNYLLVLPETSLESAGRFAERLLTEIRSQAAASLSASVRLTASIGFAALDRNPVPAVLDRAADNLEAAQVAGGDCCVGAEMATK